MKLEILDDKMMIVPENAQDRAYLSTIVNGDTTVAVMDEGSLVIERHNWSWKVVKAN